MCNAQPLFRHVGKIIMKCSTFHKSLMLNYPYLQSILKSHNIQSVVYVLSYKNIIHLLFQFTQLDCVESDQCSIEDFYRIITQLYSHACKEHAKQYYKQYQQQQESQQQQQQHQVNYQQSQQEQQRQEQVSTSNQEFASQRRKRSIEENVGLSQSSLGHSG